MAGAEIRVMVRVNTKAQSENTARHVSTAKLLWKPGSITTLFLEFDRVGDPVFLLFPFFCRLFVALSIPEFLQDALHNGFFAKPCNKLVLALSLFLFDDEHKSFNRLLP